MSFGAEPTPTQPDFEPDLKYFLERAQNSPSFRKACVVYLESKLAKLGALDKSKNRYIFSLLKADNPDMKKLFGYLARQGIEIDLVDMWRKVEHFS